MSEYWLDEVAGKLGIYQDNLKYFNEQGIYTLRELADLDPEFPPDWLRDAVNDADWISDDDFWLNDPSEIIREAISLANESTPDEEPPAAVSTEKPSILELAEMARREREDWPKRLDAAYKELSEELQAQGLCIISGVKVDIHDRSGRIIKKGFFAWLAGEIANNRMTTEEAVEQAKGMNATREWNGAGREWHQLTPEQLEQRRAKGRARSLRHQQNVAARRLANRGSAIESKISNQGGSRQKQKQKQKGKKR